MSISFFLELIKNPLQISTLAPTSKGAGDLIVDLAEVDNARTIVELGAAHGNITKQILKSMKKDAKPYSIELNRKLFEKLSKIKDKRLTPIHGDASNINLLLKNHGVEKADCIISTLPLVTLPKEVEKKVIKNSKKILNGPFVQIRYSNLYENNLKKEFSKIERHFVGKNLPPTFIYKCLN